ncbi:MAG: hypothetical protein BM557_06095 [Flavobacterium sp. MedPE-SWcel]|uniref:nuclease-related domain-containing protein n=1 Tax=uncultured Flavobacterium sp. TaxID=165435 RepID=UPI0009222A63|nr:nuclease-related domain-containing protein [uncultured Flavobacterium sp.]OIQ19272.1 MAG: hypothetical protein BM557_06095 [Flavobacterium sp. MedPE-SWcel]
MVWWVIIGILFLIVAFFVFNEIRDRRLLKTVTDSSRGTGTERDLVLKLLKSGIPAETIFHDLYLKMYGDNYAQIDLAVITDVGLIVFEVKDYSGWIFGTGYQQQWTQVLAYGEKKYRFYNPIMQNAKHIKDLKKHLRQQDIPCFSVIVFYGDCVLKDIKAIPDKTTLVYSDQVLKVLGGIKRNNETINYNDMQQVVEVLKKGVVNGGDSNIQAQHIENVNRIIKNKKVFH